MDDTKVAQLHPFVACCRSQKRIVDFRRIHVSTRVFASRIIFVRIASRRNEETGKWIAISLHNWCSAVVISG